MKGFLGRLLLAFILVPLIFCSCTEEQDFNQFNDLRITPLVASGLIYLESDEATINAVGGLGNFYVQTINFDAFNEQFVSENLLEGTLFYEIDNTTSKRLAITIEFLDAANNVLDVESFDVQPNQPTTFVREVDYGPTGKNLNILRETSSIRVAASNLSDSTSISSDPEPKVILRTAAEFLFQLK